MEALGPGQVSFRVHGARSPLGAYDRVSAAVFASKLGALVGALRAADRAVNGSLRHDYKIFDLAIGSAVVVLSQEPLPSFRGLDDKSGVSAFDNCIGAISDGEADEARKYGRCVNYVSRLARGSEKDFGYGELQINAHELFRIDGFLAEQAKSVIVDTSKLAPSKRSFFKGFAHASFDGEVKEADLRGSLPQIKLVIGGGAKEIDCICREEHVEQIRQVLDRRARVSGRAFYDGASGLPRRVEVVSIVPVKLSADFTRWKGAFEPFVSAEWVDEA